MNKKTPLRATCLVFLSSAALAAAPVSVSFAVDPRVELLSVVLMLSEPAGADPGGYAAEARAAFSSLSAHPAVARLSRLLGGGAPANAPARVLLHLSDPPELLVREPIPQSDIKLLGGRREADAFLDELRDFAGRSKFMDFFAAHRAAYQGFVETARRESLHAISPASVAAYLGRPFDGGHRFLLAALFPAAYAKGPPLAWRGAGEELRLRPGRGLEGGRVAFAFDSFEGSVAAELAGTAAGALLPGSAGAAEDSSADCLDWRGGSLTGCLRTHLAYAVALRALAQDLGEGGFLAALGRHSSERVPELAAFCERLKELEGRRTPGSSLSAVSPRFPEAISRLWLRRAALAAGAGDREAAFKSLAEVAPSRLDLESRRRLAFLYQDLKDYGRAQRVWDELVKSSPGDASLRFERASLAARAGERGAALAGLAEVEPSRLDEASRRRLAALYRDLKDYARARRLWDGLVANSPQDASLRLERADLAARAGERAAALAALAEVEPSKLDFDGRRRLAFLYEDLKDYGGAKSVWDGLINDLPGDASLRLERASLAARAGERESALRSAAEIEPSKLDEGGRRRLAALYRDLKDYGRARGLWNDLLKDSPGDASLALDRAALAAQGGQREQALAALAEVEPEKLDAGGRRRLALLYESLKDYGRARRLFDELVKSAPADAALALDRASLAVQAGEREAALKALAAVRLSRLDLNGRHRLALLYQDVKEYGRARRLLDELAASSPGDASLALDRAALAVAAGERGAALAALAGAEPSKLDLDGRHRLALLYQDVKEYAPALRLLEELARERPTDAGLAADLGLCKYLRGDADGAMADLRAAIKLDPRLWSAYLNLGSIHAARGRYDEALGVYDAALSLEPGEDPAVRNLLLEARKELPSRPKPKP
ncbi:MAG: tetratricopeptide repeat protein [Elusimicrobia bacterium]|nr:tetratricopeptide repeat protein [Elusimicrobiota bacterium]